ncbi:MAG TPA: alpha/beta hydrolase [Anaerolineales bacterium]
MGNEAFDEARHANKRHSRARRVLLVLAVLLITPGILGASYQSIASAIDKRSYPPPGQLVDVGGYQLHIHCIGDGTPTVILDAANQGTVSNWVWIQSEVAKTTRVCAYDRAGLGWSDLSPEMQDTQQNAQALHALLNNAGIQGPYVLVGHSLGGLYARTFAEMFPSDVVGIVFIEGTHPDVLKAQGLPDVMPNAPDEGMMDATPFISRLGLLRLLKFPPTDPDLPEQQRKELKAYLASTKWAEMIKRQYHLFPTLLAQVRPLYGAGSVGDIPLAVVVGSEGDGGIPALAELFEGQAALSPNGMVYRIEGATHISLVDRQEHALQSSAAILDVVNAARK